MTSYHFAINLRPDLSAGLMPNNPNIDRVPRDPFGREKMCGNTNKKGVASLDDPFAEMLRLRAKSTL
jgi:hypothetical protein